MKSAYELAMERLQKSAPTTPLSERQKLEIAEIDEHARAKIAEREIFLSSRIAEEEARGDFHAANEVRDELRRDIASIKEDSESKKEAVRGKKEN